MSQLSMFYSALKETEKAYVAGVIDSDGWIMIRKYRNPASGDRYYYTLRMAAVNTHWDMIEWLEVKCGGRVHVRERENPNWADAYVWQLDDNRLIQALLVEISPYLIRKKAQAEVAMQFPPGRSGRKTPQATIDMQDRLCEEMRALNARGPKEKD